MIFRVIDVVIKNYLSKFSIIVPASSFSLFRTHVLKSNYLVYDILVHRQHRKIKSAFCIPCGCNAAPSDRFCLWLLLSEETCLTGVFPHGHPNDLKSFVPFQLNSDTSSSMELTHVHLICLILNCYQLRVSHQND